MNEEKKEASSGAGKESKPLDSSVNKSRAEGIESPKSDRSKGPGPLLRIRGFMVKSLLLLLFVLFLLGIGLAGGLGVYPKVEEWLAGRGINIGDDMNEVVDDESGEVVRVTSEESVVIEVVKENMASVVSIAVVQTVFDSDNGEIADTNNIGSGFIVDPKGLIVTNQHVVSDKLADYKVVTNEGKEYEVKEIVRDDFNDIALLRVDAEGLNPVQLGNSESLMPGQMVIAIGTPLGDFAGSVTTGVISGLDRSIETSSGSFFDTPKSFDSVIQTDAAINPGNSGGPLLNSSGEVIGVNFATRSGADNISFALPISTVKAKLDEYKKFGKFIRPYVGIEYEMITELDARYYKNVVAGAYVVSVVPDSPADRAGIERKDIVIEINGEKVLKSFGSIIQKFKVGDKVSMKLWRAGEEVVIEVELGEAN